VNVHTITRFVNGRRGLKTFVDQAIVEVLVWKRAESMPIFDASWQPMSVARLNSYADTIWKNDANLAIIKLERETTLITK
jgi:hypothetical protein